MDRDAGMTKRTPNARKTRRVSQLFLTGLGMSSGSGVVVRRDSRSSKLACSGPGLGGGDVSAGD